LAISKEAVSLVLDVVEHPPEHHPYSALKQSLVDSHQLTNYHKMEPLGTGSLPNYLPPCYRPVSTLCGLETSIFIARLFLERLPAELRIALAVDDHQNRRAWAKKADVMWSLHCKKSSFLASVAILVVGVV
jgi:hypothetical protein